MTTRIETTQNLDDALKFFSPYPTYFITTDGGCICDECVAKERRLIDDAITTKTDDGWRVSAMDVNWESVLYCDHCDDRIISAYIEDEIMEWHDKLETLETLDKNGASLFTRPSGSLDDVKQDIALMEIAIHTIEEDNA